MRLSTANGQLVRPVQRLYYLEVDVDVAPEELREIYDKRIKTKPVQEPKRVSEEVESNVENVENVPCRIRSGRTVKRIERFD